MSHFLAAGLADYSCPDGSIVTDPSKLCPGSGAYPADQAVQADLFYCPDGSVVTWGGNCSPAAASPAAPSALSSTLSNFGKTLSGNAVPILAIAVAIAVVAQMSGGSGGGRRR